MKKTNVLRLLAFATVCTLMVGCAAPAGGGATTTQNLAVTTTTTQTETTVPSSNSTTATPTTTVMGEHLITTTATPSKTKTSADLMKNIKAGVVTGKEIDDVFAKASTQLALDLFKAAIAEDEHENVLVSPLSVQMALAMTANGAAGKTLEEMETVLGGIKIADLNRYLYTYNKGLPTDETCSVKSVNGIWFRNGLNVKQPFLKTNAEYYGAAAYQSAFNAQTVKDINSWVNKQTDGLIDSLVDEIDNDDMMYLVNALLFEASWASKFSEKETRLGTFVTEDGKERKVAMLYNRFETCRLGDDKAEGFAKGYKGGKYSFVAMLPNEGVSVDEYIRGLTVDGVRTMLQTPTTRETFALLFPKFDVEYEFEMEDTLQALGMKTAFDGGANFSGIANGGLWLDEVLQKTAISVSETGTKAAAATKVRVTKGMAKSKIEFTRPFVYMIVDNDADMPLFIGTVKDLKGMSDSAAAKFEKEHPVQESIFDPKPITYTRSFGESLFTVTLPESWEEKTGWSLGDLNKYRFSDDVKAGISIFADGLTYDGKEFPMLSLFAVKKEDTEKTWAKIKTIPDLKMYDESTPKMWGADGIWYCEEKNLGDYTIFSVSVGNLMSEKWAGMNDINEAWQEDILIEKDSIAKSVSAKTIK